MTAMAMLFVHENDYTGTLPSELGEMTGMKFFPLYNNFFTGTLPSEYAPPGTMLRHSPSLCNHASSIFFFSM